MAITFFAASILFLLLVAWVKKIPLLSPYGVFTAFQCLYNIAPWVVAFLGIDTIVFSLLRNLQLAERQLLLSATANCCFSLCFLFFYKRVRLEGRSVLSTGIERRNTLFWSLLPLFLAATVLGRFYGWNQITTLTMGSEVSVAGGMFTVAAYVKYAFVAGYLYYLYRFGFDKWAGLLLLEHTVVMLVDGARTTYLPIALFSLILAGDNVRNEKRRGRLYLVATLGIVLSLVTRALILTSDTSFVEKTFGPVMVEGTMGDYSALQSLLAVMRGHHLDYTFGLSYIVDPLVWFVPTGHIRDSLSFFQHWVDSISPMLQDQYSPMGGFYYGAEATAAFSYAGPAVVTTAFGLGLVWIERKKNAFRMLYMTAVPTIGILFVKVIFGNLIKLFLIQLAAVLCFVAISALGSAVRKAARRCRTSLVEIALGTERSRFTGM